jgi:geranylgeranyl pyrophosphate synthase
MTIYESVLDYISNLAVLTAWPEAMSLLNHAASAKPRDWRLPIQVCEAVGGAAQAAIPASASLACSLIAILLIDDMLDEDPRGEYRRVGEAQAANFASAFIALASKSILQSEAGSSVKLAALESLHGMLGTLAFGQYLDAQNPASEEAYWRLVRTKSAPFFACAMELGALFGGASDETVFEIGKIGGIYGEMIQIHDEMNDCMAAPANPDWTQGRSPLPILFAQSVDHPARARFLDLRAQVPDAQALQEAQKILIECGAISYCIDQLLRRYESARRALSCIHLVHPEGMEAVLEELVAPVRQIIRAIHELPQPFP